MDLRVGGLPEHEDNDAFECDFYREEDNHMRGVVLNSSHGPSLWDSGAGDKALHAESFDPGSLELPPLEAPGSLAPPLSLRCPEPHPWFSDAVAPPLQPSDPLFRFETTTAFVDQGSAADLGNSLLNLFDAESTAAVMKARPHKFTMTVSVQCQGFACELKVRIYRRASGFAAEFQRRSGEVFVFTAMFQRARAHLGIRPEAEVASAEQAASQILEPPKSELVMLPMLRFGRDAESYRFPCEALLSLAENSRMLDKVCVADLDTSYWGPLMGTAL